MVQSVFVLLLTESYNTWLLFLYEVLNTVYYPMFYLRILLIVQLTCLLVNLTSPNFHVSVESSPRSLFVVF